MTAYILLLLLAVSPSYTDNETWEERSARMSVVANAIDDTISWATCTDQFKATEDKPCTIQWSGTKKNLALLLVTMGYWESRFAKNVHEGKCKPKECDPATVNGVLIHRARSPWQIQRTSFVKEGEWVGMVGTELRPTTIAARIATRVFVSSIKRCPSMYGALSGYANMGCTWDGIANRYKWLVKMESKKEEDLKKDAEREKTKLEERLRKKQEEAAKK